MTIPSTITESRVFPLNLTPFEDYMLWDDRPDYPMTFVVELEFQGQIDRAALESALVDALARHPLLQAHVGIGKGNRLGWISGNKPPQLDWGQWGLPIELKDGERIDLHREVGLRIWVRANAHQAIITTQFHHAVCDGIGSYQFLGDWLWYYAARLGQPLEEHPPPVDAKGLRARVKAAYDPRDFLKPNGKVRIEFSALRHFAFRSSIPLATARNPRQGTFPSIQGTEFDKDQYKQLRHVAEARGQSTNELLLERLLKTIDSWNSRHGGSRAGEYAIMMPMDLREPSDPNYSAANVVTYAFVRREKKSLEDEPKLIDSLREEMVHLKHHRHRSPFMNMLAAIQRVPTWMKRAVVRNRCLATAILSNTGDPTKRFHVQFPREGNRIRCGNLILEDIRGVPPMRCGTRVTVSIFTYRRVLKICLRCDPHYFDQELAGELLELYRDQINQLLTG
jgi:hypothetical protein